VRTGRRGPRSAVMACPARAALREVLTGPHVRASHRAGDGWLWTCSCTSGWNRSAASWDGVEEGFHWHLLAVERLRQTRAVDPRQHSWPGIDTWALTPARVIDVELPPWS
jgi:hypothetical protein